MTKRFLLVLFLFFITSSVCFAVPDTIQKGEPTFVIYDVSYNVALRNKLEDDFHKKYAPKVTVTKDTVTYTYNYPQGAYAREVLEPYHRLKKPYDYKILSK